MAESEKKADEKDTEAPPGVLLDKEMPLAQAPPEEEGVEEPEEDEKEEEEDQPIS